MSDVLKMETSSSSWTKRDYLHIVLAVLIKFGDGVEIYLPGVITQLASCELGLSPLQEGFLAVILFVFFAVAIMTAVPLSNRFGERFILLLSLYTSILFAVLCAVVPNYWTLLLSRALIGLCVGLNSATIGVFISKNASSKEVATLSSFIQGSIAFTLGGGWVSILGWLILDIVSWREFVLYTSIPVFLPPIIMLHLLIKDDPASDSTTLTETDRLIEQKVTTVSNFTTRVIKAALFVSSNVCIGYGSIILLPSVIRSYKEDSLDLVDGATELDRCQTAVQGNDLLIIAAVTGGSNVIGRPLGYLLRKIIPFRALQSVVALITALSYGILLANPGLAIASVLMGIGKLSYSIQGAEASILPFDLAYFGSTYFALGAGIVSSTGMLGAILGTSLAAFCAPNVAVLVTLMISITQVIVICAMTDR